MADGILARIYHIERMVLDLTKKIFLPKTEAVETRVNILSKLE